MFTARYGLSPYIKEKRIVLKGLILFFCFSQSTLGLTCLCFQYTLSFTKIIKYINIALMANCIYRQIHRAAFICAAIYEVISEAGSSDWTSRVQEPSASCGNDWTVKQGPQEYCILPPSSR